MNEVRFWTPFGPKITYLFPDSNSKTNWSREIWSTVILNASKMRFRLHDNGKSWINLILSQPKIHDPRSEQRYRILCPPRSEQRYMILCPPRSEQRYRILCPPDLSKDTGYCVHQIWAKIQDFVSTEILAKIQDFVSTEIWAKTQDFVSTKI